MKQTQNTEVLNIHLMYSLSNVNYKLIFNI